MSLPQNLGRLSAALTSDASLNIGVGVTPSGSFKLEVGTTSKFTGVATFGSTLSNGTYSYTLPGATGTLALVGGAGVGTVTSVAAITLGTTGTDLSSTVANGTTTPVITLQVPTASATNRGALSSADWSTFNGKQGTITLTTTGTSGAATFSANTLNIPNYGSALSSYLPLAGGTLTGDLSIAYTSANLRLFLNNTTATTGRSWYFNSYSNGNLYVGNTTAGDIFNFSSAGAATLTGALSGTSATFSGIITANSAASAANGSINIENTDPTVRFRVTGGTANSRIYEWRAVAAGGANDIMQLRLWNDAQSSASTLLSIASTGAATFTGDVAISKTGTYSQLQLIDNTASGSTWVTLSGFPALGDYTIREAGVANHLVIKKTTGNVGIGTASPGSILDVQQSNATNMGISFMNTFGATSNTAQTVDITSKLVGSGLTGQVGSMIRTGKEGDYSSGAARDAYMSFSTAENDALAERMRISSNGNVSIGTTDTSQYRLLTKQSSTDNLGIANLASNGTSIIRMLHNGTIGAINVSYIGVGSYSPLAFFTSDTEAMRITSGGLVGIGTSSVGYTLHVQKSISGNVLSMFYNDANSGADTALITRLGSNCNNTGSYYFTGGIYGVADKIYIYGNGNIVNTNGSYGTLSDITLKENIIDATPKLDDILNLKVRNFNLIGDDTKQIGFIAQEFEQIFPSMIDIDGKSGKKAIKTSVLVPMLVKAIQELKAEIDLLKGEPIIPTDNNLE